MSQALSAHRASVALLRAAYPNAVINPETVTAYEAALGDLDGQAVMDAVSALVRTVKFMPTIAEIRETVGEKLLGLPTASEAWIEASQRSSGTWGDRPRNPVVTKAIEAMGGTYLIKTSDNPTIMHSQFTKAYAEMRARAMSDFSRTGRLPELDGDPAPRALEAA